MCRGVGSSPVYLLNQFITQEMKHLGIFQINRLIFYFLNVLLGTWFRFLEYPLTVGLLVISSFLKKYKDKRVDSDDLGHFWG